MSGFKEGDIVAGAVAGFFRVVGPFKFTNEEEGCRLVEVDPKTLESSRWTEKNPLVLPVSCLALLKPSLAEGVVA